MRVCGDGKMWDDPFEAERQANERVMWFALIMFWVCYLIANMIF